MGIEPDAVPFGIIGVIRNVVLDIHAERRAAHLVAANDALLLRERRAVPAFDQVADDAREERGIAVDDETRWDHCERKTASGSLRREFSGNLRE